MFKKILAAVTFFIVIQAFAEGPPTPQYIGLKIFMNDGRVLKGYFGFADGSEVMGIFHKYQMGTYRYEPPAYIRNYIRKGDDLKDWLNLTNLALQNKFKGFEEKVRRSGYEEKNLVIYKEIIPLDGLFKDFKGMLAVPDDEVVTIHLKDVEKLSLDPDSKESVPLKGGLHPYLKEEIELLKNHQYKYRIGLSFGSGSIVFYLYKDMELSRFLKLINCYLTTDWTPFIFNDVRFRHPPNNLQVDILGVSKIEGLSNEDKEILINYFTRLNQMKINRSKYFLREDGCRNKDDNDFGVLRKNGIVTDKEYDID